MNGCSGESARSRWAWISSSDTMAARSSSESISIVFSSCDVRNPSKKCRNGTRVRERRGVRDERHVVRLLHRRRSEHREARLADRHDVGVVAEDREPLSGERPRRDMQHGRCELTGDLVHVRDHEQQPLRRGERRRQGATLQRAVEGARRAAFALHLDDRRHATPEVRPLVARPLVGELCHRRRRGNRVDAADLAEPVCNRGSGLVPIDSHTHLKSPPPPSRSHEPDTVRNTPRNPYSGRS